MGGIRGLYGYFGTVHMGHSCDFQWCYRSVFPVATAWAGSRHNISIIGMLCCKDQRFVVYRLELHPPFSRNLARFSTRPWRISSARARFMVERERLRSLAMVPMAYQLSPSWLARSWRYTNTCLALALNSGSL